MYINEKTCTIDKKLDEEYKLIKDELTLYKGMVESVGMAAAYDLVKGL